MARKRDYAKEYREFGGTEEQKMRRAQRNKVRREAIRKHGKAAMRGKEVDHVGAPRTGSLASVPTQIISKAANRRKQPKRS